MRRIKVNGIACHVSKNEAKTVSDLQIVFSKEERQTIFERWVNSMPYGSDARARRNYVGLAMGLKIT
jgi:hypothetical protein